MNYGSGTGNYGQHPGMAMGQPTMHQQQHMLNMASAQHQQQRMIAMQQQQQAAAMRTNAVYQGMHTTHSGQMSIYGVPKTKLDEMMRPWPEHWKSEVYKERNLEKRSRLAQKYQSMWESQVRQQQQFPQGMMSNPSMMQGGMMFGQPGAQPPPMMNQMPMTMVQTQPRGNVATQMRMNPAQAGVHGMMPLFPTAPQSVMNQQPPSVPQISSNASVPSPSPLLSGQSPQVINPATPQNPASIQPGSIDTNPPSQHDPEYIRNLQELKKLADPLRRIIERCNLDQTPPPKAHDKLLEVMEEKRLVSKDFLLRLLKNTNQILDGYALMEPLNKVFRKLHEERAKAREEARLRETEVEGKTQTTPEKKKQYLNPFGSVAHLFVQLPPDVVKAYSEEKKEEESKKRPIEVKEENEVAEKKARIDEEQNEKKQEDFKPMEMEAEVKEEPKHEVNQILRQIDCMFSKSGKKWELSVAAANELSNIPWTVDPDSIPPSYKSPDVTVCMNANVLCVPPLCVQIPGSYPEKAPVIHFDRSFPFGGQLSAQLATLFERQLSKTTGQRSITTIYESYKSACEELIRLKRLHHSQMSEKSLLQKLVV